MSLKIFFDLKVREKACYLLMRIFSHLSPIKQNKVFFLSFSGKSYSDNPKAISEALYSLMQNKIDYVWAFRPEAELTYLPDYVKTCRYNSLTMLYHMCTSQVWVSNFTISRGTYKRKTQYYIQTWHGDRCFKKILHDDIALDPKMWFYETKHADLMISGSEFGTRIIRSSFKYQGKIMNVGCPRNDALLNKSSNICSRIKNRYHCGTSDHILLYAPTFRQKYYHQQQDIQLDFNRIIDVLEKSTGENWKIFLRSHSANAASGFDVKSSDSIITVTDYPDMNEILQVVDILITDYSSSASDFALSGNLVILYQSDIKEYEQEDRKLYFDMAKTPFYRFKDAESLYTFLKDYSSIDSVGNDMEILDFYGSKESGISSKLVAEKIVSIC